MEAMLADEAAPDTGPDEPPVTAKPTAPSQPEKASDAPRSGLDFLRATAAPVTPEPPRSTVHDSALVVTPTPTASPIPVPFTLPPTVAGCSKDPPPPSPSPTPSMARVSLGPPSATSAPKRARSGKWAQSTLLVGGRRIPPPEKPDEPAQKEAELPEEGDIPVRADTGSPALTKTQLREQMYLELDVTEIAKTNESTTSDLTERYLTPEKAFRGEGKSWLVNFLKVHKEGGGKQVRVRGVDGAGRPINHLYTMHERKLKRHKHGSTYADCVKLCRKFSRDCVDNLNNRLDDLGKLGPTKLFWAGKQNVIKSWDEEEEEEEEDDEVEQAFGDDQEIVGEEEAEDNPFLSDDEDVEEVYFIDKPVH
ncbi:unnamed protein product [Closterium sp. NIES-64]|nr:unnamed protein product [Closterium sp. NIES-64]